MTVFAFDEVPFERRLAETIAWSAARARADDPKCSLRTESLRPGILERDRPSAVRTVATQRADQLRGASLVAPRDALAGGRLLLYFPDANLEDRAAEVESGGFFDACNVPPWDTWIAFAVEHDRNISFQHYVIAWVPPALVACASAGISVNPECCIAWIEEVDVRAREELRRLLQSGIAPSTTGT